MRYKECRLNDVDPIAEDNFDELESGETQVQHFYFSFRSMIILRNFKGAVVGRAKCDWLSGYEVASIIENLLHMFKEDVEKQEFLRNLIDHQFVNAQKFYYKLLAGYTILYFLPFVLQLWVLDGLKAVFCLALGMLIQIPLFGFEVIQIGDGGAADYFSDGWNWNDFSHFIVFMIYFVLRYID